MDFTFMFMKKIAFYDVSIKVELISVGLNRMVLIGKKQHIASENRVKGDQMSQFSQDGGVFWDL